MAEYILMLLDRQSVLLIAMLIVNYLVFKGATEAERLLPIIFSDFPLCSYLKIVF